MGRFHHFILAALLAVPAFSCQGERVGRFSSESQKFEWGSAYAWMAKTVGSEWDAREGSGHLNMNLFYDEDYLNKGCTLELLSLVLSNPDKDDALIDVVPVYPNGDVMRRELGEYKTGQFSLRAHPFEFSQSDAPYNLNIDVKFTCEGEAEVETFTQPIEFSLVYPTNI